ILLRGPFPDNGQDGATDAAYARIDRVIEIDGRDDWPQAHLLTVQDGSYDYLCADNILQYVEKPDEALASWIRVLKPGGVLRLIAPDGQRSAGDTWRLTLQEPDQPKGSLNLIELLQVVCH